MLQCSYFVFEGLLEPPYDEHILKLIFILATWHALAKLRLHSEDTLAFFECMTKMLGAAMRAFARHVCPAFDTRELPTETIARQRRAAAKSAAGVPPPGVQARQSKKDKNAAPRSTPHGNAKRKKFNMKTYKYHRLGDYPSSVQRYGTHDNTSTQPVSTTVPPSHTWTVDR